MDEARCKTCDHAFTPKREAKGMFCSPKCYWNRPRGVIRDVQTPLKKSAESGVYHVERTDKIIQKDDLQQALYKFRTSQGTAKALGLPFDAVRVCVRIWCLTVPGKTHYAKMPEYNVWVSMRQRCTNPRNTAYANYGGRGIKVCSEWDSFIQFLEDMGRRPSTEHTIERIDNNGPYAPHNCKWALSHEQQRNRRKLHKITFNGRTMVLADWARDLGLHPESLRHRIERGWPIEKALTVPPGKPASVNGRFVKRH